MAGLDGVGSTACLAYEVTRRIAHKSEASTSKGKEKALEEYVEEANSCGRGFPFQSGVTLATPQNKNIFLSRNGYLQGKAWRAIGVCRQGKEEVPYVLLVKARTNNQLAIIQHKELTSLGYHPFVTTRTNPSDTNHPGLQFCCNTDCSLIALWTSTSLHTYNILDDKKACKKFALKARAYLGEDTLLACEFAEDGESLVLFSYSDDRYLFKTYNIRAGTAAEIGRHKLRFKLDDLDRVLLNARGESVQVLVCTKDRKLCTIDSTGGEVFQAKHELSSSPVDSITWHPQKGLILYMSGRAVFALDQALQPLQWSDDKLQVKKNKISTSDLFDTLGTNGAPTVSWDPETRNAVTVASEEETVLLRLMGAGGAGEIESTFGTSHNVLLGYLRSKEWAKMESLLHKVYLTSSDLTSLVSLVEEMAKMKAVHDMSAWQIFSRLLKHVAKLISNANPNRYKKERASFNRIALDFLSEGKHEAAVAIASAMNDVTLNEFLYQFMMQNQEARLANICWSNIKNANTPVQNMVPSRPKLLFAPSTLRALSLQKVG